MVQLITLATVILGGLLLLPLLALGRRRPANIWLGLFVYAITSLALADYCKMTGLYLQYPQLWGLFDWPVAAIGAFFYCYVRSIAGLGNSWRQSFHFLPLLLLVGLLLQVRMQLPTEQFLLMLKQPAGSNHTLFISLQVLAAAYGITVIYRLWQYRRRIRQQYAATQHRDLIWLQWLTLAVMLLLVLWFPAVQAAEPWFTLLILGRLLVLYAFGWFGLRQQQVFLEPLPTQLEQRQSMAKILTAEFPKTENLAPFLTDVEESHVSNQRYAKSGMTDAAAKLIGERLTRRMQLQKDYLENDLTLSELAQRIGTSPQLLSEYLNVELQQNFFDFINSQRVAEVQRQLIQALTPANILSIALAAGFNSKSTFNAAFRKHSGMTPSAWRAQQNQ